MTQSNAATMQGTNEVLIDEELEALIPRLSREELAQLEQNILAEGCRDKLVVWDDGPHRRLLDGHNRLAICKRHGLGYEVDVVALPDREAAIQWVLKHQLGRRNLSPEALSYLRGRLYNGAKRQGARTDLTSGQSAQKSTTADQIAAQHKVDGRTIRRDAEFAEEIDALAALCGTEIKQEVLARNARIARKDVKPLLTLPPSSRERVIAAVRGGAKASTLLRDLGRHNSESSPGKPKKTEGAPGGQETALQSVERATKILGNMSPGAIPAEVLDRIEAQVQSLNEEIKRHRAAPTRPDGPRVDVLAAVATGAQVLHAPASVKASACTEPGGERPTQEQIELYVSQLIDDLRSGRLRLSFLAEQAIRQKNWPQLEKLEALELFFAKRRKLPVPQNTNIPSQAPQPDTVDSAAIALRASASQPRPASTPPLSSTTDTCAPSTAMALMESAPPDILHRAMQLAQERSSLTGTD